MAWKIEFEATAAEEFEKLDGSVKTKSVNTSKKLKRGKIPKVWENRFVLIWLLTGNTG